MTTWRRWAAFQITGYRLPNNIYVARDGWDWLLYALSLFAALGVALAFWTWFTQLRQTPEVWFQWEWDNAGAWHPTDQPRVLNVFGPKSIRVHLVNVGTGSASKLVINVLVPDWLQMRVDPDHNPSAIRPTADPAIGGGMGTYQLITKENLIPGTATLVDFTITVPVASNPPPREGFVALSVASERFIRTGRRWLPSMATRIPTPGDDFWADWSIKKYRRKVRIVRAMPDGVKAGPGQRMDRRSVSFDQSAEVTFNNERLPISHEPPHGEEIQKQTASTRRHWLHGGR